MPSYVIQRNDGQFVSKPGAILSYTNKLQQARIFKTLIEAECECCPENERARLLEEVVR